MLTAEELADLRALQEEGMPASCTVSIPGSDTEDAAGGTTPGTPVQTTVACRIGVPTASDMELGSKSQTLIDAVITLPYGTTVTPRTYIDCSTNGKRYHVEYHNTEQSWAAAVRVLASEVRNE